MQTLRTQLKVARLELMKRRVSKSWTARNKPIGKEFCAASALQTIDLIRVLDSMHQPIDDAMSMSATQSH